jgi:TonB family protein
MFFLAADSTFRRLTKPVCLAIGAIVCGCTPLHMAFEGNPMPEEQVATFLKIVSPKSAYDTPPKFKRGYAPFFPVNEARKRQWGYAMAEFTVTPEGETDNIRIIAATAVSFAQEAGITLQDWRFIPAQKNGRPVAVTVRLPFTFRLSH